MTTLHAEVTSTLLHAPKSAGALDSIQIQYFIIDESGNFIVDESGNFIVSGAENENVLTLHAPATNTIVHAEN
jgi:hypothetical protein